MKCMLAPADHLYVIAESDYMHIEAKMWEFTGTWRGLLLHLTGLWEGDENELVLYRPIPPGENPAEDDPHYFKPRKDFANEELLKLLERMNGDGGGPVMNVYDVTDHKTVVP